MVDKIEHTVCRVWWIECGGQSRICGGAQSMEDIMGQTVSSVCEQNGTDGVKSMVDKMG